MNNVNTLAENETSTKLWAYWMDQRAYLYIDNKWVRPKRVAPMDITSRISKWHHLYLIGRIICCCYYFSLFLCVVWVCVRFFLLLLLLRFQLINFNKCNTICCALKQAICEFVIDVHIQRMRRLTPHCTSIAWRFNEKMWRIALNMKYRPHSIKCVLDFDVVHVQVAFFNEWTSRATALQHNRCARYKFGVMEALFEWNRKENKGKNIEAREKKYAFATTQSSWQNKIRYEKPFGA